MDTPFFYYTLLDLPKDASISEIKTAYRKKALKYHPDKCRDPSSAEKFKEINQAFHVLSDLEKRRCYDNFGGLERPEIPITITKPFEDFCEGIALGSFTILSNVVLISIFGVPSIFGLSIPAFMAATQLMTAWQLVPDSIESASELRNWAKAIGTLASPIFLLTAAAGAAGYAAFNGSKLALEYTKDKMGDLGNTIYELGGQVKKGITTLTTPKDNKLSLTLDDWVMLDDKKGKKEVNQSPPASSSIPSVTTSIASPKDTRIPEKIPAVKIQEKSHRTNDNESDDWVLLDDSF